MKRYVSSVATPIVTSAIAPKSAELDILSHKHGLLKLQFTDLKRLANELDSRVVSENENLASLKLQLDSLEQRFLGVDTEFERLKKELGSLIVSRDNYIVLHNLISKRIDFIEQKVKFLQEISSIYDEHMIVVDQRVGDIANDMRYLEQKVFVKIDIIAKTLTVNNEQIEQAKWAIMVMQMELTKLGKRIELNEEQIKLLLIDMEKFSRYGYLIESLALERTISEQKAAEITEIEADPYKSAFYKSLRWNLNAAYFASLVVQTDIVQSSQTGYVGKTGAVLSLAASHIPLVGIGVKILGKILQKVDSNIQVKQLAKYAHFTSDAGEMAMFSERIAREMLRLRSVEASSTISSHEGLFTRLARKTLDFAASLSDAAVNSAVNEAVETAESVAGFISGGINNLVTAGAEVGVTISNASFRLAEQLQEATRYEDGYAAGYEKSSTPTLKTQVATELSSLATTAADALTAGVAAGASDPEAATDHMASVGTIAEKSGFKEYAMRFFRIKKPSQIEQQQKLAEKHAEIIAKAIIAVIMEQDKSVFPEGASLDDSTYERIVNHVARTCIKEEQEAEVITGADISVGTRVDTNITELAIDSVHIEVDEQKTKAEDLAEQLIKKAKDYFVHNNTSEKEAKFIEAFASALTAKEEFRKMKPSDQDKFAELLLSRLLLEKIFLSKDRYFKSGRKFSIDVDKLRLLPLIIDQIIANQAEQAITLIPAQTEEATQASIKTTVEATTKASASSNNPTINKTIEELVQELASIRQDQAQLLKQRTEANTAIEAVKISMPRAGGSSELPLVAEKTKKAEFKARRYSFKAAVVVIKRIADLCFEAEGHDLTPEIITKALQGPARSAPVITTGAVIWKVLKDNLLTEAISINILTAKLEQESRSSQEQNSAVVGDILSMDSSRELNLICAARSPGSPGSFTARVDIATGGWAESKHGEDTASGSWQAHATGAAGAGNNHER